MDFNQILANAGMKPTEPADLSTFSMLLHSVAGCGKTSLAATASKVKDLSPVLYIDTENGTMPLLEWGDMDNITIYRVSDWPQMQTMYEAMGTSLRQGTFPYKTVVIDTIDRLQEYAVSFGEKTNPRDGFFKWNLAFNGMNTILSTLFNAPEVNVIAITHSSRETNQVTGEVMVGPSFEGRKSGEKLPSLFDFVGQLSWIEDPDDEDKLITILTTQEPGLVSKKRIRSFPQIIANPTMEKVYSYIRAVSDSPDSDNTDADTDTNN